jgi:hypothetical protein
MEGATIRLSDDLEGQEIMSKSAEIKYLKAEIKMYQRELLEANRRIQLLKDIDAVNRKIIEDYKAWGLKARDLLKQALNTQEGE